MDVTVNIAVRITSDKEGHFEVCVAQSDTSGHSGVDTAVNSVLGTVCDRVSDSLAAHAARTLESNCIFFPPKSNTPQGPTRK
jgi:ribose 5-phosphate isomerase RpiB